VAPVVVKRVFDMEPLAGEAGAGARWRLTGGVELAVLLLQMSPICRLVPRVSPGATAKDIPGCPS